MASIATYTNKPHNQELLVPGQTLTAPGATPIAPPSASQTAGGSLNGWLVLIAQGANPTAGTFPVIVDLSGAELRFAAGIHKVMFVGFKFVNGMIPQFGQHIRFEGCRFEFPLATYLAAGGAVYKQHRQIDVRNQNRNEAKNIEFYGCDIVGTAFGAHNSTDWKFIGSSALGNVSYNPPPWDTTTGHGEGITCQTKGAVNLELGFFETDSHVIVRDHPDTSASGAVVSGLDMHDGWVLGVPGLPFEYTSHVDGVFGAVRNIYCTRSTSGTAYRGEDATEFVGGTEAFISSGQAINRWPTHINVSESNVRVQNPPGGTQPPWQAWRNTNPYSDFRARHTDIFPDTTQPAGFYRDRIGLSWGSYTAWNTIGGTPSTGVRTIQRMIRDDQLATWARIDWGVGAPNFSAVDTQLLDHVNNGCKKIVVILNGGQGNGGSWPNTSDGDFPNVGNETAFRASMRAIAQHIRATVGAGTTIVYECGNEVTATMKDASGVFIIGKYAWAYSLMYPELKAGDPACLVGPSAPVRNYTRIPSGAPGSDFFNMNLTAAGDGQRTWCSTDYFRDACDGTVGGILEYHTGSIGLAPTFVQTGFDMLFIHPYSQEEGPLGQTGAAPGVLNASTCVNTLREVKYSYDSVFVLSGGTVRPQFWGSEMGYATAPTWAIGRAFSQADVCYDPVGAGSTSGVIGDPAGGTQTLPNIRWNRGTKWSATTANTGTTSNRPGQPGAPWVAYTTDTTYNHHEAPNIASEENEAGQHAYNQMRVWFGEIPDVDGRYISGPNAGPDQMTGVLFYYQPLDGPGPSNNSASYNYRYGVFYLNMSHKGNPTSAGAYQRMLALADTPLGTTNFGRVKTPLGTAVRAVGKKKVTGRAFCHLGTHATALGTKNIIFGAASTALVPLGLSVNARGTAFIIPPPQAPDPPTIVTAVAGDGYADVAWNASPNNHGSPVIQARVIAYTSTGVQISSKVPTPATALSMRYAGLTNGMPIKFTVAWANATAGFGAESAFSNTVTPTGPTITAPDAPAGVTATTGTAGQATVTWTASVTHGTPVTGYVVTASTGETTSSTTTSATFTGLSAGARTFTVQALSSQGPSPVSSASNSVTVTVPVPTTGGLGNLTVNALHPGDRTAAAVSDGTKSVNVLHVGDRTVEPSYDGTRTVELLHG